MKVWEVKFSRSGDFEKAARAFDLTGGNHEKKLRGSNIPLRSSEWSVQLCLQCRQWENGNGEQILVFTFAFVLCMVKVSKDGSWKVFNTAIEFSRGQDAEVLVATRMTNMAAASCTSVCIASGGHICTCWCIRFSRPLQ